jgi:hypothetical protein
MLARTHAVIPAADRAERLMVLRLSSEPNRAAAGVRAAHVPGQGPLAVGRGCSGAAGPEAAQRHRPKHAECHRVVDLTPCCGQPIAHSLTRSPALPPAKRCSGLHAQRQQQRRQRQQQPNTGLTAQHGSHCCVRVCVYVHLHCRALWRLGFTIVWPQQERRSSGSPAARRYHVTQIRYALHQQAGRPPQR